MSEAATIQKCLRVFDVVSQRHAGNAAALNALKEVQTTMGVLLQAADPLALLQRPAVPQKIPIVVTKPRGRHGGPKPKYTDEQRAEVFRLWQTQELTYDEIGQKVGIPKGSVGTIVFQIRKHQRG